MVPHVINVTISRPKNQESEVILSADSLQNEWAVHCSMLDTGLEISLELFNAKAGFYPVIGIYHVKSSKKEIRYDMTHLFSMSQPKCMGIVIYSHYLEELIEDNLFRMKVDIRLMQQVFPF